MLKSINPILGPELLHVLASMGHGDELVLVDCNFPCHSVAASTVYGKPIRLDGITVEQASDAILSVFPLDSFVETPLLYMQVVGKPDTVLDIHREFKGIVDKHGDRDWKMASIERYAFYERARKAYAVVSTTERKPYGCFILTKGVLGPDGNVL